MKYEFLLLYGEERMRHVQYEAEPCTDTKRIFKAALPGALFPGSEMCEHQQPSWKTYVPPRNLHRQPVMFSFIYILHDYFSYFQLLMSSSLSDKFCTQAGTADIS